MATPMPVDAPTPWEQYLAARDLRRDAESAASAAQRVLAQAVLAEKEARYRLALSVPCPYCSAAKDADCTVPDGVSLHRMPATHGVRHSAAQGRRTIL